MNLTLNVNQIPPDVLSEGVKSFPAMSKIGQLFTADWQTRVVQAGLAFRVNMGTITADADITMVGQGTVIDLELPSCVVVVDSGFLVPMSLNLGINCNLDTTPQVLNVLVTDDRATGISAAELAVAVGVAETPTNCLDGAAAFSGRCISVATVNTGITDPVHSSFLYFNEWNIPTSDPLGPTDFNVDHVWADPTFIAGACSLLLYVGGSAAATFVGSLVFAHIPASWLPTS